jgi:Flp pilus assembly protein TadG
MRNSDVTRPNRRAGRLRAATLWRDSSGNVAMVVGLMATVLVGVAGYAMDYAYASYIAQRMHRAAEAAVLGAVSQSAATAMGGYSNSTYLQNYGVGLLSANMSQLPVQPANSSVTVQSNGTGGVTASASYSANVPTFFSNVVGIKTIPVSGSTQASATPITYINYYFIIDISQSMGIGATSSDMSALYNRVVAYNNGSDGETGCVFGCHVKAAGQTYTNEYLAHSINPTITLRIDSAASAVQSVITAASQAAGTNKNIKIGLYTMSEDPTTGILVNVISAPSSSYSTLYSQAATIDLGNNTSGGSGDSDFTDQLTTFNAMVPANGSGVSAVSPLNYVFIITDGVTDTPGSSCTSGHCTSAFSASNCTSLKTKATVGVIYTTYNPIYAQNNKALGLENNYSNLVNSFVSQVPTNLQACASSSKYYFQASDGPAITTAMQALFAATQQNDTLQK